MIKEYQVTLVCSTGQYKPVSCIVKKDDNIYSGLSILQYQGETQ